LVLPRVQSKAGGKSGVCRKLQVWAKLTKGRGTVGRKKGLVVGRSKVLGLDKQGFVAESDWKMNEGGKERLGEMKEGRDI